MKKLPRIYACIWISNGRFYGTPDRIPKRCLQLAYLDQLSLGPCFAICTLSLSDKCDNSIFGFIFWDATTSHAVSLLTIFAINNPTVRLGCHSAQDKLTEPGYNNLVDMIKHREKRDREEKDTMLSALATGCAPTPFTRCHLVRTVD